MGALTTLKRKVRGKLEFANPRGVVYLAQRRIRNLDRRRRIAQFVTGFLPRGDTEHPEASHVVRELEREGFAMLDGLVTPAMATEMREHFLRHRVHSPYIDDSPHVLIDDAPLPDSHFFIHDDRAVLSCPHALAIANNPKIISAMEAVLGCKPTIGYMTAWWSVPTADGVARNAENFHRDVDDLKFIKLFVYLTDVGPDNGPHEFIRGSHVDPRFSRIRRYSDDEVRGAFGAERQVTFTGTAGSAFLENTYGLHRGLHVQYGRRLVFQVIYSVLACAYAPPRPLPASVAAPVPLPLDPYINRLYLQLP